MEKISDDYRGTPVTEETKLKLLIDCANKINEIVDSLNAYTSQPNCKHNWVQGSSGYWCDKCNKYKV
jgi:hypothetical protein